MRRSVVESTVSYGECRGDILIHLFGCLVCVGPVMGTETEEGVFYGPCAQRAFALDRRPRGVDVFPRPGE